MTNTEDREPPSRMAAEKFRVQIDQLPEEELQARDVLDLVDRVTDLLTNRTWLRRLADEEPVQIKRSDRCLWGRNLTIGDFRRGLEVAPDDHADGPVQPPSP